MSLTLIIIILAVVPNFLFNSEHKLGIPSNLVSTIRETTIAIRFSLSFEFKVGVVFSFKWTKHLEGRTKVSFNLSDTLCLTLLRLLTT